MKICGLSYIDEYEGLVLKRTWIYVLVFLFIIVFLFKIEHALTNNSTKFE
jgi:hypothetical protein